MKMVFLRGKPAVTIGNHMISSAIWKKYAQAIFFKDDQNLQVLIYSKLHEKNHKITY